MACLTAMQISVKKHDGSLMCIDYRALNNNYQKQVSFASHR